MIPQPIEELLGDQMHSGRENILVQCPFHDDRTPSMSINLSKGVYYCWGCGEAGGLRSLAQRLGGDFSKADMAIWSVRDKPDEQVDLTPQMDLYQQNMYEALKSTRRGRPLPLALDRYMEKFVGYEEESRVLIPIFGIGLDASYRLAMPTYDEGRCISIKFRDADGNKQNAPGSVRTIYNLNNLRGEPTVILAEGESDTHMLWLAEAGAVHHDRQVAVGGVQGAISTKRQWEIWALDLLWAKRVYIAFDADEAGDKGAENAMAVLGDKAVRVRPRLGKDWCDEYRKGGSFDDCLAEAHV